MPIAPPMRLTATHSLSHTAMHFRKSVQVALKPLKTRREKNRKPIGIVLLRLKRTNQRQQQPPQLAVAQRLKPKKVMVAATRERTIALLAEPGKHDRKINASTKPNPTSRRKSVLSSQR